MSQTFKSIATSTRLDRCVYIIGPQSTGKTTLVNALVRKLAGDIPVIKEVARHVLRDKNYSREDVDSSDPERRFSLQRDIFAAQIEMENRCLGSEKNIYFLSDRSAIDPIVYLAHYSGTEDRSKITSTQDWREVRRRYADTAKSSIILLLPVIEFLVDDDIRYVAKSSEDWHALATSFQEFMKDAKIPYVEIGEECLKIEERVTLILKHLSHTEE